MPSDATLGPFRVLRPVPPEAGLGPNVSVAEWGGDGEHAGERVLLHHYEAKGLGRARAFRELGQAKDLRHRALAKVHGWYEEDGALVAVLEHVEGARLDQIVGHLAEQGARLGDDAIAELSLLIAEAVAHAQEAKDGRGRGLKLVHGTLATDRVVLGWDGRVKIYGTALRSLYVGEGRTKAMRAYTAPELRGGSHGTSRGDVFALGMIMWTLYTGRIPEPHGPPPEKIGRFRPDLDDALKRCIDTAVKRVALERRVTCRGIAQLLQTIVTTDTLASEVKAFADLGLDLDQPYAEPVLPDDDEEDVATLPPSVSEPPDDEDRLRMPTPPGVSEDSTIERLSDLFDTLEVGSEEPAPDSTTDEGWLVDVVRKSSPEFLAAQVPDNKATPTKPASKKEPDEDAKPKEPPPPPLHAEEPEPPSPEPEPPSPEPEPPSPSPTYPADMIVPGEYVAPAPSRPKRRPWLMAAVGAGIGLGAAYFVTTSSDETAPPAPIDSVDVASTTMVPTTSPEPTPSTEPAVEPSAEPSAEPSSELPAVKEDGGDPSELLSNQAYLIVHSPIAAEVVVQGVSRGMTNEKIVSSCYTRNVRLRDPKTKAWLSGGQAVIIPCMQTTEVTIEP